MVIGILLAFFSQIVNIFYYDPGDTIFKAIPEKGVITEAMQRLEVDMRVYNELYNPTWDFDVRQINDYVKKNGLKVYGFALIEGKDELLRINDMDNVYCIATEPYN